MLIPPPLGSLTHLDDEEEEDDALAAVARNFSAVNADLRARQVAEAGGSEPDAPDTFAFQRETDGDQYTTQSVYNALAKARNLSTRVRIFTQQRDRFREVCEELGVDGPFSIPSVSKTRWYSVHEQLILIVRLWPAIDAWQDREAFDRDQSLAETDLHLFRDLIKATKPLYDLTHLFSSLGSPRIGFVLDAIDRIFLAFTVILEDTAMSASVHNAVLRGYRKVSEYYNKTTPSLFYSTAVRESTFSRSLLRVRQLTCNFAAHTVLHPSKRVKYLELEEWDRKDINDARVKAKKYFKQWYSGSEYAEAAARRGETTPAQSAGQVPHDLLAWLEAWELTFRWRQTTAACLQAEFRRTKGAKPADRFDAFVDAAPTFDERDGEPVDSDGLEYWLAEQQRVGGPGKDALVDFSVDIFVAPGEFPVSLFLSTLQGSRNGCEGSSTGSAWSTCCRS